jgi:hypothetical protein
VLCLVFLKSIPLAAGGGGGGGADDAWQAHCGHVENDKGEEDICIIAAFQYKQNLQ